ncbi:hypothetical protein SK3146_03714 [Paenibacillus konkukensis]|uniref:LiaF transmembrane domain-containing protein n=1 Tax=Paenibacillus konkukensis TaxID=2020716 RepID=A0ABY4RQR7_9BACL|nr:DUF5668 domain-containing protein [Paenibacillus konkukensis]UQZ84468.1 hypothetical protein SK3146_03714 [Paenibacillus konkukensis]
MKKWRVGTLSMGISLILLGCILFASQWKGLEAFDTFITWWPLILVLLGLEIIVYLSFSRKEESRIHYDMMSLFFVGMLCVGCLGFTLLTSVGLVGEVRSMLGATEETRDLPPVKEALGDSVKKVVVQSADSRIKIDKSSVRELQVFGTFRERLKAGETSHPLQKEQVVSVHTAGETMYVQIKPLPTEQGLNSYYPWMTVTVVLPQDVQVELRGADNRVIS